MNPKAIFGVFVAVAAVQLAVPLAQIMKHEGILKTGKAYKFRTAPVDPADVFRGRYVALSYADTRARVRSGDEPAYGRPAYVGLATNEDGFARFTELSVAPPAAGDYLRVEYRYKEAGTNAHFGLPFDKLFLEETQAPQAEEAYRRFNRRNGSTNATYVVVRVRNGRGVIEDLYIQDTPIRKYLRQDAAPKWP